MLVLGIETSCDETASALFEDGKLLCDVVASQDEIHAPFGGVVPELASRRHIELIGYVVKKAMRDAGKDFSELDAVAVTQGPGLVVCLLVGLNFAKGISFSLGIPIIGVNHLEGHLMAIFGEEKKVEFPFLGLVVSGGHTSIYLVRGFGDYLLIGQTIDDAAGEAFDKVAKAMGLGYPGGKLVEAVAKEGNKNAIEFPKGVFKDPKKNEFNFSFSGLKTAVVRYLKENKHWQDKKRDIAASFQESVVSVLIEKTFRAEERYNTKRVVVSGGVASNQYLRNAFMESARKKNVEIYFPSPRLCTDNAGMIATVGYYKLMAGIKNDLKIDAQAVFPLENWR